MAGLPRRSHLLTDGPGSRPHPHTKKPDHPVVDCNSRMEAKAVHDSPSRVLNTPRLARAPPLRPQEKPRDDRGRRVRRDARSSVRRPLPDRRRGDRRRGRGGGPRPTPHQCGEGNPGGSREAEHPPAGPPRPTWRRRIAKGSNHGRKSPNYIQYRENGKTGMDWRESPPTPDVLLGRRKTRRFPLGGLTGAKRRRTGFRD